MLYQAQFNMMKADRIIYGTPLMEHCGKTMAAFVLAFMVKDKRIQYLEALPAYSYRNRVIHKYKLQ